MAVILIMGRHYRAKVSIHQNRRETDGGTESSEAHLRLSRAC